MRIFNSLSAIVLTTTLTTACFQKKDDNNDSAATVGSTAETPTSTASSGGSGGAAEETAPVAKSSITQTVAGSLLLTADAGFSLTKGYALLNPSSLRCEDAVDGTIYDEGVAVGSDGSFTCEDIPQCYDEESCATATPVQVNIIDEATENTICVASSGAEGLVCDVAGCFAAAQAALDDDVKACLTSVNMVAASNVFQDALNKANKMGQIPLDRFSLAECIDMTNEEKLSELQTITKGSLAEVMIDSLDSQLQKEINRCDPSAGEGITTLSALKDFLTMGFGIGLSGENYTADLDVDGSIASELAEITEQIKTIKIAVANNEDPFDLVTAGTVDEDILKFQLALNCYYAKEGGGDGRTFNFEVTVNAAKDGINDCASSYSHENETYIFGGYTLGTKIDFPDINDPQGNHNREGDGDIPLEYEAFKLALENDSLYSLEDIYEIFFTEAEGLNFRIRGEVWNDESNNSSEFVIDSSETVHTMTEQNQRDFVAADYAPSFAQVFGFLTDEDNPFDLDKVIRIKTHRDWNPTGQQYFYVAGKEVNNKNVPVSCDIVDEEGNSVGLNIAPGVSVSCVATSDNAQIKKYFINNSSNPAFVSLINKENGFDVRTPDGAPVYLQNLNISPGPNMPTCTTANQVSIFKYNKSGEYDDWLDGRTIRTVCLDFSAIKNPAEYYLPYNEEIKIGTNTWTNHVLSAKNNDGEIKPVCVSSSSITTSEVAGCLSSSGVFTACSDQNNCSCNWQNGEDRREFDTLTQPSDGSLSLTECSGSSVYYLQQAWEPGVEYTSQGGIKLQLLSASDGRTLEGLNSNYDPNIVNTYIKDAFDECKDSKWCWRKEDIKNYSAHTEIPDYESWMKRELVRFYCGENSDNATIRSNCSKLEQSTPLTVTLAKFSNAANTASSTNYEVFRNESYFSHMEQPNPNYNRVFDYDTYTFKYANYDPFCDDVDNDGACSFSETKSATNDIYFSNIWRFNDAYKLFAPVANLSGYTFDADKSLFPAEPSSWDGDYWRTYIDPVYQKIGGASALACSNDRSKILSWDDVQIWSENTWRTAQEATCENSSAYFVVRNIVENKNTYLVDKPDLIQTLMRLGLGTVDKQSIDPTEKRFDFVQAMSIFILSMEIPPLETNSDGSYEPYRPKSEIDFEYIGYQPTNYNGKLTSLIELFEAKGLEE